ncbi:DUF350 domain-containing protein [Gilvibacter sediminis]|uniref:DUF350 domain-containing protein n=1 Tax=Gilvibacter sediminis TaxID=379071 RepID=UPI002350628C|nr:DUF350 domain-containing protein [Gilvibacter sediminis]MDC7997214.1 DUF350 domain-containing protein [Gilvibacter sediminis]
MDNLFYLSVLEIVIGLILSVGIFFMSFKLLKLFFFRNEVLEASNQAFAIFCAGIFISIGLILSELVPSITNVIRTAVVQDPGLSTGQVLTYAGLSLTVGFIIAVLINGAVFLLFSALTKGINEFESIKNNNASVATMVASLLVSITLIVKNSIAVLISTMVPFPEVSNFL